MLTICLLILIYSMLKKPVASLVAKIKDADWKRPARNFVYCALAGRLQLLKGYAWKYKE